MCIKFLSKFEKTLEDADRSSQDVLTEKLKKACSKAKNRDRKFVCIIDLSSVLICIDVLTMF